MPTATATEGRSINHGLAPRRLPVAVLLMMGGACFLTQTAMSQIVLSDLPWDEDALEPYISAETIGYHYGAHHAGYVTKVNAAVEEDSSLEGLSVEELMKITDGTVFNSAAQVYNHDFYWRSLSAGGSDEPTGDLMDAINDSFGSFEDFKVTFAASASGHFGSGWAWLVLNADGGLEVLDTHDASNPVVECSGTPILTCDVWEHAYYIDYRNLRSSYIESWWNIANWEYASEQYDAAIVANTKATRKECKGAHRGQRRGKRHKQENRRN